MRGRGPPAHVRAVIVVPHGNRPEKNAAMRALVEHGDDFQTAFEHSQRLAAEEGLFAMPSMDAALIPGVATYALKFSVTLPHSM
jgi:threonine dehydratase